MCECAAIRYVLDRELWIAERAYRRSTLRIFVAGVVAALLTCLAFPGCSRPAPSHPPTVAPAEDCPGGVCHVPGAMR